MDSGILTQGFSTFNVLATIWGLGENADLGQHLWVGAWHPYKPFLYSDAEAGRPGPHFEWQEFPKNSPASTRISNISSEEPNGEG